VFAALRFADTGCGAREYSVRDLDGDLWSFGNHQPWPAA
jgi:hypothetical protein